MAEIRACLACKVAPKCRSKAPEARHDIAQPACPEPLRRVRAWATNQKIRSTVGAALFNPEEISEGRIHAFQAAMRRRR